MGAETFPSQIAGHPTDWDFYGNSWTTRIVPKGSPILLFDAVADAENITADHRDIHYDLLPSDRPGTSAMAVDVQGLDEGEHDHSFRFYFKNKVNGRSGELAAAGRIVVFGRSSTVFGMLFCHSLRSNVPASTRGVFIPPSKAEAILFVSHSGDCR